MKSPRKLKPSPNLLSQLDWDVIHPNDIVVLRGGFGDEELQLLAPMFEMLSEQRGVLFFILPRETLLETLSEEEMNRAGWYKKDV